jgi:hypothetical protein
MQMPVVPAFLIRFCVIVGNSRSGGKKVLQIPENKGLYCNWKSSHLYQDHPGGSGD